VGIELDAPDWTIEIAPDLALSYAGGAVRVSGTIDVPRAAIELDSVPASLPKPSADVTVVGREKAEPGAGPTTASGQVRIRLGNDVRYRGFGLDVRLEGELEADIENMEVVRLRGELRTREGRLEAQGQTLTVQSGRVLYTGAVDNPYLDLVATREITDHTEPLKVGLRVRGPADQLETSVFSEPVMSQTRALSFLVLGRDLNETEGGDNSLLINAAIGLGLKGAIPIVDQLKTGLRLDELTAAAGGDDVEIIAGKRVTKDLYVRYTYNALASISAFVIRYSLNERWRLEASSSDAASMDLLYKIER
jgi:translocation and assembly module TamB